MLWNNKSELQPQGYLVYYRTSVVELVECPINNPQTAGAISAKRTSCTQAKNKPFANVCYKKNKALCFTTATKFKMMKTFAKLEFQLFPILRELL